MTLDEQMNALVVELERLAEAYATDKQGEFDLQKYLAFKDGLNMGFQIWAQALKQQETTN